MWVKEPERKAVASAAVFLVLSEGSEIRIHVGNRSATYTDMRANPAAVGEAVLELLEQGLQTYHTATGHIQK